MYGIIHEDKTNTRGLAAQPTKSLRSSLNYTRPSSREVITRRLVAKRWIKEQHKLTFDIYIMRTVVRVA